MSLLSLLSVNFFLHVTLLTTLKNDSNIHLNLPQEIVLVNKINVFN